MSSHKIALAAALMLGTAAVALANENERDEPVSASQANETGANRNRVCFAITWAMRARSMTISERRAGRSHKRVANGIRIASLSESFEPRWLSVSLPSPIRREGVLDP